MSKNTKITATIFAITAAVLYALNVPVSKLLLDNVPTTMMAGILYLGAGTGMGVVYLLRKKSCPAEENLCKNDLLYVVLMVGLDVAAPICLMLGLSMTASSNTSLLNNFEIVATAMIALALFGEKVSGKLWISIALVTVSSVILSVDFNEKITFSWGSSLVLAATVFWGLENNCTRKISNKNTYQIVTVKGLCSGLTSVVIACVLGENVPQISYILYALLLGFVAYGLSIFFYVKAQRALGAAKTGAYYAVAPFVAALLSFVILGENPSAKYFVALAIMIVGTAFAVWDTFPSARQKSE